MSRQLEIVSGRRDGGENTRPRVEGWIKQVPSRRLRLLRRSAPRNDVRAVGRRDWGLSVDERGSKNAKQSHFARVGIHENSFAGKGL